MLQPKDKIPLMSFLNIELIMVTTEELSPRKLSVRQTQDVSHVLLRVSS